MTMGELRSRIDACAHAGQTGGEKQHGGGHGSHHGHDN